MSELYLSSLSGNIWRQYADVIGQIFYVYVNTHERTLAIPGGWEDQPTDAWPLDPTKTWPQWNNSRTGRAFLIDPNPPPQQTYLDDIHMIAHLTTVQRVPESPEVVYRRVLGRVLLWVFPEREGYTMSQEELAGEYRPDFMVFKIFRMAGGTLYEYEFLMAESKRVGEPWGSTAKHFATVLAENGNPSHDVYGMVQIGLEVQFFKYQDGATQVLSGRLHLMTQVQEVIHLANQMKANPLPAYK